MKSVTAMDRPVNGLAQDRGGRDRPASWELTADVNARARHGLPLEPRLSRPHYERELRDLQVELTKLQSWIKDTRVRMVILFEGRDAAGKGGAIKRFAEHLNPRQTRVVCLDKPSEVERGQWYFQRYIEHLPTAGEMVLFDRSWYNRAGVERVMGFCTEAEYAQFFPQAVELEHNLISSGIVLFKLWFDVSRHEQMRRMLARSADPLKRWKLSPVDVEALNKWDAYSAAEDAIFAQTATPLSPWVRIKSDCKRRARLAAMRYVLGSMAYPGRNDAVVQPARDPAVLTVTPAT
ncbi:MAG: polyphosphate kinase 2 [Hyphomonadaceae bacterium]|nr:polyphosphate kinase 2 [Hyphomonadaceae bacterium]